MKNALPALAGLLILAGCAVPGEIPDETPTVAPSVIGTPSSTNAQPRGLAGGPKQAPARKRPVDVEAQPWDGSAGKIQEFRIVVDEVTRYCLVLVRQENVALHCFDSSEVP